MGRGGAVLKIFEARAPRDSNFPRGRGGAGRGVHPWMICSNPLQQCPFLWSTGNIPWQMSGFVKLLSSSLETVFWHFQKWDQQRLSEGRYVGSFLFVPPVHKCDDKNTHIYPGIPPINVLLDLLQSYSLQPPTQVAWTLASWWISLEVVGNLSIKRMKLITYFWASPKFLRLQIIVCWIFCQQVSLGMTKYVDWKGALTKIWWSWCISWIEGPLPKTRNRG